MEKIGKVWISWERQRRTLELSKAMGCRLNIMYVPRMFSKISFVKYFYLSFKTFFYLFSIKPKLVVCQNPSIVLAFVLSYLKKFYGYVLVVDRHSNFKPQTENSKKIKWKIFHFLSKFSIKRADLTIVTNENLCKIVQDLGGKSFVLQDKLPELTPTKKLIKTVGSDEFQITYVCTFSEDEPFCEVIESAKYIPDTWHIYITGNKGKISKGLYVGEIPSNVHLTGFLPEEDYIDLLSKSDAIIVLTKNEDTLVCGGYESFSLNKPCILSDTKAIRGYFKHGVVYSENNAKSIAKAIIHCKENYETILKELKNFVPIMKNEWEERFLEMNGNIKKLLLDKIKSVKGF